MRMNYSYSRDYILTANFLMMLLLPLVLISVMNTLIFLTIRRSSRNVTHVTSRQRRDRKVLLYSVHTVTCVPLHLDEGMREMICACFRTLDVTKGHLGTTWTGANFTYPFLNSKRTGNARCICQYLSHFLRAFS